MIKVLHKAFDLIESVAANKDRIFTLTELSAMIKEKPTTCANIVKTLCDRGYLTHVEPKGYKLGPVAQGLNYLDVFDMKLIDIARDPMTELVEKFGASGVLAVLRRGKKKILDDYNSDSDVIINKTVRKDHELYTTSTGLVLTSFGKAPFAKNEVEIIIKTYGSIDKYIEIRKFIIQNKYVAISLRPRILEVAAAVFKNDEICAVIAAYLPEFMVSEADQEALIKEICETADKITERI